MPAQDVYFLSPNIFMKVEGHDSFKLNTTIFSPQAAEVDADGLRFLSAFKGGATVHQAVEMCRSLGMSITEESGREAVAAAVENRCLYLMGDENTPVHETMHTGFGDLGHHVKLLNDTVRVLSYRTAIFENVRDKDVLEIGCGSGILSIFAAQAGARSVTAIEETGMIEVARAMADANGVSINFVEGNSQEVDIPKVDVIIHELIGIDPFEENMLYYLADARTRFLREGGIFLPKHIDVYACAVDFEDEPHIFDDTITDYSSMATHELDRYGVNVTPIVESQQAIRPWQRRVYDRSKFTFLSNPVQLGRWSWSDDDKSLDGISSSLKMRRAGVMNGIAYWFRAQMDDRISLSNSPLQPETSWPCPVWALPNPRSVNVGDAVDIVTQQIDVHGSMQMLIYPKGLK